MFTSYDSVVAVTYVTGQYNDIYINRRFENSGALPTNPLADGDGWAN